MTLIEYFHSHSITMLLFFAFIDLKEIPADMITKFYMIDLYGNIRVIDKYLYWQMCSSGNLLQPNIPIYTYLVHSSNWFAFCWLKT